MAVTATVVPSCRSVSAGALSFGTYRSGGAPVAAQSAISVTCDKDTAYSIRISGDEMGERKMKYLAHSLGYTIYRDAARSHIWGDSPELSVAGRGAGVPQHHAVFGEVHRGQPALPGDYGDTVTITLDF
jgi:spore coat protein U-like protein